MPSSPAASVLKFAGGSRLDSVAIELTDGTTFSHDGTGGTSISLTLGTDEYWIETELCTGEYDSKNRNLYIKATTSSRNTLEAGTSTDDCSTFTADDGYAVVGYMAQDGDEMDQVALIYAAY